MICIVLLLQIPLRMIQALLCIRDGMITPMPKIHVLTCISNFTGFLKLQMLRKRVTRKNTAGQNMIMIQTTDGHIRLIIFQNMIVMAINILIMLRSRMHNGCLNMIQIIKQKLRKIPRIVCQDICRNIQIRMLQPIRKYILLHI